MSDLPVTLLCPDKPEMECSYLYIGNHHFRIGSIGASDESEVLRLFAEVFGHTPDGIWYKWKYSHGQADAVGLWDDSGRLVAHYAGLPRTLLWYGKQIEAVQIGDVMVTPQVRGLMTRRGPLFHVCTRFFDRRVGKGKDCRVAFGFPNQRHVQLGATLGLYHDAGKIHLLRWVAKSKRISPWWRWSPLDKYSSSLKSQITKIWGTMARDMANCVLGVRDANFLCWRFIDRPDRQYRLFILSRWPTGSAVAIVVMRFADGNAELLDIIGPRKIIKVAIKAAITEAARAGAAELTAWASPAVAAVLGAEAVVEDSGASLAIARASVLTADEVTAAQWWWMGGDTDFL